MNAFVQFDALKPQPQGSGSKNESRLKYGTRLSVLVATRTSKCQRNGVDNREQLPVGGQGLSVGVVHTEEQNTRDVHLEIHRNISIYNNI